MSWHDRKGRGDKRSYHHGNLKEALIKAALELIATKGPAGLSFAEAARLAGVSAAAPYRHFRDREALLADVARTGFELFAERLGDAWNGGRPRVYDAFDALGRAYLKFAREEPALFAAMFESGLAFADHPELRDAGDRALEILREACAAMCATLPEKSRPPVLMMALHVWSMTQGIASLFARGDGARRRTPMSPEELLESAMLIYLQGLGISDDGTR